MMPGLGATGGRLHAVHPRHNLLASPTVAAPNPTMSPRIRRLIRDGLIAIGVLAILTLLAHGQVAATVLILLPMVFLIFGRRNGPDR